MKLIIKFQNISREKQFFIIAAVSLATLLPALFSGLMGDDLLHFLMLNYPDFLPKRHDFSLFNLFSFVSNEPSSRLALSRLSLLPWWIDPNFTWNFWRPLAEATHFLDYRFFGRQFWLMHLHSLLWFFVLLYLVYRGLMTLFNGRKLALLAFALFALSASHAVTVSWLSNRHAVLASCAIISALILHHKWADTHKMRYLFFSTLMVACGFLSSELGISAGVWLFCYSVFYDRRKISARIVGLLPYLIIFIVWVYLYRLSDFGIRGYSSFYIDPFVNPLVFIKNYLINIPSVILSQTLVIPADIISAIRYRWLVALMGGLVLLAFIFGIQKLSKNREYFFFLTAFFLLMVPVASSPSQDRNLLQVSIAFSGLLAIALISIYSSLKTKKNLVAKGVFYSLLVLHFIVAPLLILPLSYVPALFSKAGAQRAATLDIKEGDNVLILKGRMMESTYLYPNLVLQDKPLPTRLWNVGGHKSELELTQLDRYTLQIKALSPFFSQGDLLARDPISTPFNGSVYLDGLTVEILSVSDEGLPKDLLLHIKQVPVKIFVWTKQGYQVVELTIGKKLILK